MNRDEYYYALSHHGIKGQEWGERNGPPYPLDKEGKKALREQKKKARMKESVENKQRKIEYRNDKKREARENSKYAEIDKIIAKDRLARRIRIASQESDRFAAKVGWDNTKKSAEAYKKAKDIKNTSSDILSDDERLQEYGRITRNTRVKTIGLTAGGDILISSGSLVVASMIGSAVPIIIGAAGTIALSNAGKKYYEKTYY